MINFSTRETQRDNPRGQMSALALLDEIFATGKVVDRQGIEHDLHSSVDQAEGQSLHALLSANQVQHGIEIGCAYGVSSLYICNALVQATDPSLLIIDPYESSYWHDIGRTNLERAGVDFYTLIEEPAEYVLPDLIRTGKVFDFAFVDGNHNFEYVMSDFLMLHRLLKPGGLLIFDDALHPAVNHVIHCALNFLAYEFVGYASSNKRTMKGRVLDASKGIASSLARVFPEDYRRQFFALPVIKSSPAFRQRPSLVALCKVAKQPSVAGIKELLMVAEVDEKQRGLDLIEICQKLGITQQTLEAWRQEYGQDTGSSLSLTSSSKNSTSPE